MLDCDFDTIKYIRDCIKFYRDNKDHPELCADMTTYVLGHEFEEHEKLKGMFFTGYDCLD